MKKGQKVLFGVLFGQVIQSMTFMLALKLNMVRPALFAIASGLLFTLAVFAGMTVMGCEMCEDEERRKNEKTIKMLQAQVDRLKREAKHDSR